MWPDSPHIKQSIVDTDLGWSITSWHSEWYLLMNIWNCTHRVKLYLLQDALVLIVAFLSFNSPPGAYWLLYVLKRVLFYILKKCFWWNQWVNRFSFYSLLLGSQQQLLFLLPAVFTTSKNPRIHWWDIWHFKIHI